MSDANPPSAVPPLNLPAAARSERWAGHLAMINQVARVVLESREILPMIRGVVSCIQAGFAYYDVSFFLVDRPAGECVLMAHLGQYGQGAAEGYRLPVGVGMVGWVAKHGETLLANDVEKEPRRIVAFIEEALCRSELAVPVRMRDEVIGVINVENQAPNAFDERDVLALEAIADLAALAMANARLSERRDMMAAFHRGVLNAIPSGVCVVRRDGRIRSVNQGFERMFGREGASCDDAPLADLLPAGLLADLNLPERLPRVLDEGGEWRLASVRERPDGGRVFNIRLARGQMPEGPTALIVFEDVTQWAQAEAAAASHGRHLGMVLQCIPIGVGTLDLEGRFTFWAPGSERLGGYAAEEVVGRSAAEVFEGGADGFQALMRRCCEQGSARLDMALRRTDGGHLPVEVNLAKLLDHDRRHVGHTVCLLDVSERARAADELLREQRKLTDVVNVLGAGLALVDRQHRIVWANRRLEEWFGGGASLVGRPCFQTYGSHDQPCRGCVAERVFRGERFAEMADAALTSQGVVRHFHHSASPVLGPNGEVTHVLKLTQDVTDQTRRLYHLSRLRQLGEEMQGVLDLDRLLHFILTCVTAGQALGFNRAILLMVDESGLRLSGRMGVGPASAEDAGRIWQRISQQGLTLQDLLVSFGQAPVPLGGPMTDLAHSMSIQLSDSGHIAVKCLSERRVMVVRGVAGDGQGGREFAERLGAPSFVLAPLVSRGVAIGLIVADNLYSGRPIEEDDVEVLGMFASQAALAISNAEAYRRQGEQMQQLAQAYRQLSEAQRQLVERERLAAIGKMAAHVAHEIRNPLVTIGGYARLMLKDAALSRTARNATGVIAEEVTRLERILRGVMDFTRPPQAVLAPGAVGDVVRHVLKLIEEQARSQNVRVQVEMAAGVPLVRLDPGQMSQVFLNVAQNALDAMPGGGRLTVRVWAEESGVLVDIGNDGLPIAKEHLASIFEPFFTTKKGGTGLGLAVSRKIVHDHLGEITVRSDAAEGTHFTVKLPLAPAGAGEDATSPPLGPTSDR